MRFNLLSILLITSIFSTATEINGTAIDYPNQTLYLKRLTNGFTKSWVTFDSIKLDSTGSYSVLVPDELPLIQFQVELKNYELVLPPNSVIQLDFLHVNGNENQSFPLKPNLTYHTIPKFYPSDTIYWQVTKTIADIQLTTSPQNQNKTHFTHVFDSLQQLYDTLIHTNAYFSNWFTYTFAQSMLIAGETNTNVIELFLGSSKVLPNHPTYVKVANHTLINYVQNLFSKHKSEVSRAKKEYKITESLKRIIQRDTLLKSDELQQLALILYITSPTASSIFSQNEILAAITQFEISTSYFYQKEIATWYIKQSTKLIPKTEAPLFCLSDGNFDNSCLKNFRKSNVYLGFIHTQSQYCQKDLLVIEAFAKKYKKIKFVLVITDKSWVDVEINLPKANNIKYLSLNQQWEILQQYQVRSYPVYFLIDKFGYLIESPSLPPSEMGATFNILNTPKHRRQNFRD